MSLKSKTVQLRLVEESDAEFIVSLRTDEKYNKHLSAVTGDVEAQVDWIRRYKEDEANKQQFYFIIERLDGVRCGTIRVYDFVGDSFCWGSWILNEDKTRYAAIESAFLVYQFAFDELGFQKCHFDVRKGNDRVISFHEKMGATRTGETELDYLFQITKEAVSESRAKLQSKL
ncbi:MULTISPECIES: GNAT family N-acetyltransferase [unclassified Pseudomonas]|uniref:GNAT family N-acetyltransferase n=1 Tax=unclassified Pseudomonas TaxID=196821 RepID=UPI000C88428B|nr:MULTISPECIES: GNAT family N-acetyltransferase [unclassified Pseudomonas]PMX27598.1 N-acetyltransferase [Pseudomonas sp. MPR-R2A4]PMX28754.1 N-acetyltransferase [Pseudomonas sp. GW460-12]PMX38436.1 N-acetyltransferase [Pseudomonas sp. MPR-R2A7]PMX51348.1 N-acetyltransferase [Pseudomonas sp. MPR-R2A6]PMX86201.1 N-acetyltransferase [Pseudomonas sp. MPR-R2A3]